MIKVSDTGATQHTHFRDPRSPQEIQFQLERDLVVLFQRVPNANPGAARGMAKVGHVPYVFTLVFEAALTRINCYSLEITATWGACSAADQAGYRKDAEVWMPHYSREFRAASPPESEGASPHRYQELLQEWATAESHLDTIESVQQAILAAMRAGAVFSGVTKEGNWLINYARGRYFGDKPYRDEKLFLEWLRAYFDVKTSQAIWPETVPEYEAWKLLWRLLQYDSSARAPWPAGGAWLDPLLRWFRS